mmetsp:Transcript_16069/g.30591  ORF Transcript_16069/g.30591 Transcript_16069/m.30591 type:complete len:201 (+) Transcript_16069:827-1429(+)
MGIFPAIVQCGGVFVRRQRFIHINRFILVAASPSFSTQQLTGRSCPITRVFAQGSHQSSLVWAAIFSRHAKRFFQGCTFPSVSSHCRVGVALQQCYGHIRVGNTPMGRQVKRQESILVAVSRSRGVGAHQSLYHARSRSSGTCRVQGQTSSFRIHADCLGVRIQQGINYLVRQFFTHRRNNNLVFGSHRNTRIGVLRLAP